MVATLARPSEDVVFRMLDPSPELGPLFDVHMLSSRLNALGNRGVRIAALTLKRFEHIKIIAAFGMMVDDLEKGRYKGKHTIIVPSSGNTAHAAALIAQSFGLRAKLIMSADVPEKKRRRIEALPEVEVIITSGVAQRAEEEGKQSGCYLLNQYEHDGNPGAHYRYTGPEIKRAFNGRAPGLIAIAMGSSGTAMGVAKYFREEHPDTIIVGVRPALGDKVSGARDRVRMDEVVTLPWRDYITPENVIDIASQAAYKSMRKLAAEVLPAPGPTSGLAHAGLVEYLTRRKQAWPKGFVAAFICPDFADLYE